MIAGLEEITGGTIAIGDRVVNDLPPKDRDIAMVFQNYALYQHMTVYNNLAFGLRNRKVPEDRIKAEIDRAVEILGIGELLARKPRQLSGGQQQRVALGRCMVRHPAVFLFDEPLSNLDAKLRAQMRIELKRLRERVATTSVYVTHDQVEAMTLGDRVVVMRDGFVEQVDTPWDIYTKPVSRFVAGFIGSPAMNFLDIALESVGGQVFMRHNGARLPTPPERQGALGRYAGKTVTLGVRPEHITLANPDTPGLGGRIDVTEQLGSELQADVQIGGTSLIVSRIDPESRINPGDNVTLDLHPSWLHFFDRETEAAIQ
jgi:multiple sugar transport system ATP-binding protein